MVGTQKWSMEEILWTIMMVEQGMKDEDIFDIFCTRFKDAKHVRGPTSIKYCRTGFMRQEEYTQEKYWENAPGKIGYVLGRHDDGAHHTQIVTGVMHHFPDHQWVPRLKPIARCVEFVITKYRKLQGRFSTYSLNSPLVGPVLHLAKSGRSAVEILKAANEIEIGLDDIHYILSRFGVQPIFVPNFLREYSNPSESTPGGTDANSSYQNGPKPVPLIFELPPRVSKESRQKPRHHSASNSHPYSSRLQNNRSFEGLDLSGEILSGLTTQQNLESSLLNSGHRQGLFSGAQYQKQLQNLYIPPQEYPQLPQQYGMGLPDNNLSWKSQLQEQAAMQLFQQQLHQQSQLLQQNALQQQNFQVPQQGWDQNNFLPNQLLLNSLGPDAYNLNLYTQNNSGQPPSGDKLLYAAQIQHDLNQSFSNQHPANQNLGQQPIQPLLQGYENIDPTLLERGAQQVPWSTTQQFAQDPKPNDLPLSNLGIDQQYSGGMKESDREIFHQRLMNPDEVDLLMRQLDNPYLSPTPSGDISSANMDHDMDYAAVSGFDEGQEFNMDDEFIASQVPDLEMPSASSKEDIAASSTDQVSLSKTQQEAWNRVEEAAKTGELFRLFPDIEYENPLSYNFSSEDGSAAGSTFVGDSENIEPDSVHQPSQSRRKWPFDTSSSLEAMEVLNRVLETGMATPFFNEVSSEEIATPFSLSIPGGCTGGDITHEGTCCSEHMDFECFFGSDIS